MDEKRTVLVEHLGICEHCETLISIKDMPNDSIDAVWNCPSCGKELTGISFGYTYDDGDETWMRTRWVGKDGKWTTQKPTEAFHLGDLHVLIRPLPIIVI